MKRITILLLVAAIVACTQKPKLTNDADITGIRPPLAVEYVAVPTMNVYAAASDASRVIGTYGFTESISVLARQGDWCEIRMFDGSGWVKATDLMTAEQAKAGAANATPRFYVPPASVPFAAHGEIVLQAKVNTEGLVYDVTPVSNTTGNTKLAGANASALREAKFFPLIEKGQRKAFVYEHRVIY